VCVCVCVVFILLLSCLKFVCRAWWWTVRTETYTHSLLLHNKCLVVIGSYVLINKTKSSGIPYIATDLKIPFFLHQIHMKICMSQPTVAFFLSSIYSASDGVIGTDTLHGYTRTCKLLVAVVLYRHCFCLKFYTTFPRHALSYTAHRPNLAVGPTYDHSSVDICWQTL